MRIVIVGGGVVGYSLAEHLSREKHHLSVVELDSDLCQEISEKLDVQLLNGPGSSPSVLVEAGLPDADMVLAVTPNDEVNMVVCAMAAQYNVSRRIARIRNREFAAGNSDIDLSKMGITSVIHPEQVMVDHILQYVQTPHAIESANFENGRILMRGYRVREGMEIAHKTPLEIRQEIAPETVLFAAIVRKGEGMIPDGATEILPGDIVYSLFPLESLERFLQMMGVEHKKHRKIVITGDSYSTVELATALDKTDNNVIFVDPDLEHAERIAPQFDNIQILHGDCTDASVLREINVDTASFFVAASNVAEYNMLSCLLAKVEGAHEVIAITTDRQHDRLFQSIGIDHVLNPRLTTAREILEIVSLGQIGAMVQLSDVDIEAVRFNVSEDSEVAGKAIKNFGRKLKKGSIIGVVVRKESMIIPDGETVVEAGDHVIMIARHKQLPSLSKLFRSRKGIRG